MPDWARTKIIRLELYQWGGLAVLLPAGWLFKIVGAPLTSFLVSLVLLLLKLKIDADVRRRALRSSGVVLVFLFCWWAVNSINLFLLPAAWLSVLMPVVNFGLVLVASWAVYRFVYVLSTYVEGNKDIRITQFDEVFFPCFAPSFGSGSSSSRFWAWRISCSNSLRRPLSARWVSVVSQWRLRPGTRSATSSGP